MNQRVQSIFEKAQDLNPAEREALAELLYASLAPDAANDAAWLVEIERRIAAEDAGEARMTPAKEVFAS